MHPRLPALVATAALALALPLSTASTAEARPKPKPRADLVVSAVTQSSTAAGVDVAATVKNKGRKKASATTVRFTLSTDAAASSNDVQLGALPVAKVKPRKTKAVTGRFAVPSGTAAGTYTVIACADAGDGVKEKKEGNNCRAAAGTVTVASTPPPASQVTIDYSTSGVPGSPLPSAPTITTTTSAGSCTPVAGTSGTCTVPRGAATVTLTATFNGVNYVFQGWRSLDASRPCDGVVGQLPSTTITFTNPTAAKGCVATYAGAA